MYNNVEPTHDLRSAALCLSMTRREYFVQSSKYQYITFYIKDNYTIRMFNSIIQINKYK